VAANPRLVPQKMRSKVGAAVEESGGEAARGKEGEAALVTYAEHAFHKQVAQFLTFALGGSVWFTTIPLGGGGRLRGALLRGVGVKPGTPDILILDGGRALWLELKSKHGKVSAAQRDTHTLLRRAKSPVGVVRNLDEVITFLRFHNVPLRIASEAA
jgi:hypothetical protein